MQLDVNEIVLDLEVIPDLNNTDQVQHGPTNEKEFVNRVENNNLSY